ncbi:MAG: NAD(P)/FAD-dependent oxidoreductase [Thermomicrobiales bacterium]|nr:NAD(P)/FAD-dependent oxidoreductase [Thermomicrobiales bacterium]
MSHRVVILGGGVGGTIVANLLVHKLSKDKVDVTLIDATGQHVYQPGWLYVPFGEEQPGKLLRSERRLLRKRVNLVVADATAIDATGRFVTTSDGGVHPYDSLVIATGARLAPEAVPGFADAAHHFYSEEASVKLGDALARFDGGRLVIGVADIPYKCPPAPLEFAFKVEEYLRKRELRERTEILYLSPINRVFTIESVSTFVTPMLEERGIAYETFFNTETVDPVARKVTSMEGGEIDYDLLVMVPPHRGVRVIEQSGLGDAQGWLPTDRSTLELKGHPGIYAIGDATDLPVSKSGSAAHFEAKVLADRLAATIKGESPAAVYDGHVLCFLETGYGKASQLVFDFEHPPQPPQPNAFHHYEKMLFNKAYWHLVPRGLV